MVTRILLVVDGVYLLIGAFAAHWFFPEFYFKELMGFSYYQDSMVKLLGLFGGIIGIMCFYAYRKPRRNSDMLRVIILACFIMALGFTYLTFFMDFPPREYINALLLLLIGLCHILFFPKEQG